MDGGLNWGLLIFAEILRVSQAFETCVFGILILIAWLRKSWRQWRFLMFHGNHWSVGQQIQLVSLEIFFWRLRHKSFRYMSIRSGQIIATSQDLGHQRVSFWREMGPLISGKSRCLGWWNLKIYLKSRWTWDECFTNRMFCCLPFMTPWIFVFFNFLTNTDRYHGGSGDLQIHEWILGSF